MLFGCAQFVSAVQYILVIPFSGLLIFFAETKMGFVSPRLLLRQFETPIHIVALAGTGARHLFVCARSRRFTVSQMIIRRQKHCEVHNAHMFNLRGATCPTRSCARTATPSPTRCGIRCIICRGCWIRRRGRMSRGDRGTRRGISSSQDSRMRGIMGCRRIVLLCKRFHLQRNAEKNI